MTQVRISPFLKSEREGTAKFRDEIAINSTAEYYWLARANRENGKASFDLNFPDGELDNRGWREQ